MSGTQSIGSYDGRTGLSSATRGRLPRNAAAPPLRVRGLACYAADVALLSKADLLKLDVATRLELIEELWDSIASDAAAAGQMPLTEHERVLLDERLREHRADPDAGQPWAEVRAEILKQR